jgi:uncharacterized damage-inducible protein DinB
LKTSLQLRLEQQPDALQFLLQGLSDEQIHQSPAPGKWSIHQNIAHLGRYHQVFIERVHKVLETTAPDFERYSADEDPEFSIWTQKDTQAVLLDFDDTRQQLNDLLQTLSAEQLSRTGNHPVYGSFNIESWVEFFLLHEAHHFFTILKIGQVKSK